MSKNDKILAMNNMLLNQKTPKEIEKIISGRLTALRKRKKLTQFRLCEKAGVSYGSLKRFEQTGDISLQSLIKIAIALDVETELIELFDEPHIESIEELL